MPQTALITGASGGIGRALAHEFAQHGYDLVLVARSEQTLNEVARTLTGGGDRPGSDTREDRNAPAGPDVRTLAVDLSQPDSARSIVERVQAMGVRIDVLVNNAGFGLQGEFATLSLERQIEMIQLNVTTLTELTRLLLPEMLSRRTGGVLNVASTAAFQPGPLMSVYYATKAYVLSFTEGIAEEVAGTGLRVSCLCPGPTDTGFAARAAMTETPLFKGAVMQVEQVAREGFKGWNAGQVVVVPGFANRQGTWIVRLSPRSAVRRIMKRLNRAVS